MPDHPNFGPLVLLIAVTNLGIDITRLVLEWRFSNVVHQQASLQNHPDDQPSPLISHSPHPAPLAKKLESTTNSDIRGPPLGNSRPGLLRLPPDYSINHPPWCLACNSGVMRRYIDQHVRRQRFND